jgi:hypothetical protein
VNNEIIPDVTVQPVPEPIGGAIEPLLRLMRESQERRAELVQIRQDMQALRELHQTEQAKLREQLLQAHTVFSTVSSNYRRTCGMAVTLARALGSLWASVEVVRRGEANQSDEMALTESLKVARELLMGLPAEMK